MSVDAVVMTQQLLDLNTELELNRRLTRGIWEQIQTTQDRRSLQERWRPLRPLVDDLGPVLMKVTDADVEILAAWARASVAALRAAVMVVAAATNAAIADPEEVATVATAEEPTFAELAEELAAIDTVKIAAALGDAFDGDHLHHLRDQAATAVASVHRETRAVSAHLPTMSAAARDCFVTVEEPCRALVELASALYHQALRGTRHHNGDHR